MKLISLMLTEEQIDKLKAISKSKGLSVSALIRLIVSNYIEKGE